MSCSNSKLKTQNSKFKTLKSYLVFSHLQKNLQFKEKNIEKTPVSMIMTRMPNIVHCFEDDNIMEAIEKLIKHEIDSLPVLRKEKGKLSLVGRFTKTNVTKLFYQELKNKSI